ncbi:hypothetical protein [Parasphingopyxis lamellibrachiae]|uniref:Uncharacterized protein n=1 Tax=Parasphingopyxis lamellibrachiae TaxID=680125 RepID=A0A3D9FIS2_9SPHN|nr:hypothetical protein [Parasphingopyxis lamellibrachiae]RED17689.1 hypothetical protein DFR46_2741 [Parasphingopyxis lamellibrachiae]
MSGRFLLIVGGWLSGAAALLHLAVIIGGPDWYRFFGAGEEMARMAARGDSYPAIVTIFIASILAIWAAYAFSGAGLIRRLPLLRTGLIAISAIYLLRGLILIPILLFTATPIGQFGIWSSLIVLVYGVAYAAGTWLRWPLLAPGTEQSAS